jgi:FkbM family methyltransferase
MIKQTLLRILGEQKYLETLCAAFQVLLRRGWLTRSLYQDVYFLKQHIRPGDTCIDIGAHLGYYSFELARLTGETGAVYAVEPISKFNGVIERYVRRHPFPRLRLLKVALGGEGAEVDMGIPQVGARKRFAYAKIIESKDTFHFVETERVKNEDPNQVFGNLSGIDFIKCDVEGFEVRLFTKMLPTVRKYRPKLLCELGSEKDRRDFAELLQPLGYACYRLREEKWEALDPYGPQTAPAHNYYFLTADHVRTHAALIRHDSPA